MLAHRLHNVLGLILGGGAGSRLYPLTKQRAKPAVPIAGKYRLVDIAISNCLNSGINQIYVLTQFNSVSLHRHVYQTYRFDRFTSGYVQILAAEQTPEHADWYQGTADAVRKQLFEIQVTRAEDVLILSGDHLYRMDYEPFVELHRESRADITVAVKPVTREEAPRLGILKTDDSGRIVHFHEKPKTPEALDDLASGPDPARPYLASMGIYVFRTALLVDLLKESSAPDFGKDILPAAIQNRYVMSYPFEGYWEDIGTIRSFYEANLQLTRPDPPFDFYDPERPIYTHARFLPGSRLLDCTLDRALVADGSIVQQAEIRESIVGLRSTIGKGVRINRSIIMGADYFETPEDVERNRRLGRLPIGIGPGSSLDGVILDKNARVGANVIIRPRAAGEPDRETDIYVIRDGITIIPKSVVVPDGTVI